MSWITEDATILMVLLGLIAAGMIAAAFSSGRAAMLLVAAVAVVMATALFFVEQLIVTENERVEQCIYDAAAAVETNDFNKVLTYLAPDAVELRRMAQSKIKLIKIEEAKITDTPKIEINELTSPISATAIFHGRVKGVVAGVEIIRPGEFTLTLKRYDNEWKITGFETDRPF